MELIGQWEIIQKIVNYLRRYVYSIFMVNNFSSCLDKTWKIFPKRFGISWNAILKERLSPSKNNSEVLLLTITIHVVKAKNIYWNTIKMHIYIFDFHHKKFVVKFTSKMFSSTGESLTSVMETVDIVMVRSRVCKSCLMAELCFHRFANYWILFCYNLWCSLGFDFYEILVLELVEMSPLIL